MKRYNHLFDTILHCNVHMPDGRALEVSTIRWHYGQYATCVRFDDTDVATYGYADDLYDARDMQDQAVMNLCHNRLIKFVGETEPTYSPYVRTKWWENQ